MIHEQGSEGWLQERLGHATASRANDILATIKSGEAAARKNYRTDLIVERLTGQPIADTFISEPMKHGTATEPFARAWYCQRNGVLVSQMGFVKHKTIPWVGCSVDGEVDDDLGLEIKAPNTAGHFETLLSGMPAKHMAQVQFQCWVMGWKAVDFVSYDNRVPEHLQGCVYRIQRDEKYIAVLELAVVSFLGEVDAMIEKLNAL